MSLEEQIGKDYVQAMKSKDSARSSTLSFLRAQIKNFRIDARTETVKDEDVVAVIKKQVKQRQDSITQFEQGGRMDLVGKEKAELAILKSYLPEEMSPEAIKAIVAEVIKNVNATSVKDMGKVMKEVLPKVAGKADGKLVSDTVKELLSRG